ncbi:MAG: ComEC/Rec2 family competence protein [Patescibacteria group bacterium]|jgi:competence protein ComEC
MSKRYYKYLLGLLAVIAVFVWQVVFAFPDAKSHVVFCDVGQGDAILLYQGFTQVLIDGGPNDKVLDCLSDNMPFFDKTLEMVILTHPDADHLTGLDSVLDKYSVKHFVSGPEGADSSTYQAFMTKVGLGENNAQTRGNLKVINTYAGDKLRVAGLEFLTLWPAKDWLTEKIELPKGPVLGARTEHKNLNDFSLVFLAKVKDKTILLMGDADSRVQSDIVISDSLKQIDILKYAHHGSKTGMREDFLAKLKPKEAVISVGKNNFGYPSSEALSLLEKFGAKIRRTDVEGEIHYRF